MKKQIESIKTINNEDQLILKFIKNEIDQSEMNKILGGNKEGEDNGGGIIIITPPPLK